MSSRKQRIAAVPLLLLVLATPGGAHAQAGPRCDAAATAATAEPRSDPAAHSARQRANAARRAALSGDPGTAALLREARSAARALPADDDARLDVLLHVAVSRARWIDVEAQVAPAATTRARRIALLESLQTIEAEAAARGDPHTAGFALLERARVYAGAGRAGDALRLLDRAIEKAASGPDVELLARVQSLQGRILDAQGQSAASLASHRGARRTLARLRGALAPHAFLQLARPIHRDLADRLLRSSERAPDDAAREALLREALDALEDTKAAEIRDYFEDECLLAVEETTPDAVPGTAMLYPAVLEDRVELLFARNGRIQRVRSPASPDMLIREARRLRKRLQDPTTPRFRETAESLYDALIRPLGHERLAGLRAGDVTLVFVPDGVLREIPLAALRDRDSGRYLVEDVSLAVLPSLRLAVPEPLPTGRARVLVAGLTRPTDRAEPLPFVAAEIESVVSAFAARSLVDASFSLEGFEAAFSESPWDIVHIASHGQFATRSGESFLLTHDGRLTLAHLGELVALTRSRTSRPLELLTLSACETAIGDDRAALGLAGIAIQSGARSAVATLWRVHDEASSTLIAVLYRELAKPGVSRALALQRAQQALIADPRLRHPYYWAPFLLINSWR